MIIRRMRFWRWIGHSGISAVIAEQLGTAMMPLCSAMRRPLISGIANGTSGSMRNADELSMTTAPAFTAIGENLREGPLPAENSAISTSSKESSRSSSISIVSPRKPTVLPADLALARALSLRTGNRRLFKVAMNSAPTAPVTPAMATTGFPSIFISNGIQAIKKPRTFLGGASDQMMRLFDYARTPPEPPKGLVLVVALVVALIMGPDLWARISVSSTDLDRKSAKAG